MDKIENHKLQHEVANSIAAIRTLAQANIVFIRRMTEENFNLTQPKYISLIENSMLTIQKELSKIENAFETIVS